MALKTGLNITESDWKRYLEQTDKQRNGIRTWRQRFGNASLGYNAQSDALHTDYASAIAEAYKSNFAQRNAILGAGLSAGSTQQLLTQSQADLHAAYDTYIRNYGSAASALAESYGKEVGAIDKALTERATNFVNLYNSAYKYLSEELYGTDYFNNSDFGWTTSMPDFEPLISQLMATNDPVVMNNLMAEYQTAVQNSTLKSWDELSHLLVDSNGNLTMEGTKFFDQIFNAQPQGYTRTDKDGNEISVRTFDQWLSDTNPTLRDWAVSTDAFNSTRAGTNFGSAKVGAGMESDDIKYHSNEYLTDKDVQPLSFNAFDKMAKLQDYDRRYKRKFTEAAERGQLSSVGAYSAAQLAQADTIAKERQTAWTDTIKEFGTTKTAADNYYKTLLGTDLYNKFWKENPELERQFNAVDKSTKTHSTYNSVAAERVLSSMDTWIENYNIAMSNFIKKYGYSGKTSGL